MSQEVFLRGLFAGIFSLAFAWVVFSRYDSEIGYDGTDREGQKYLPYIPGALLPLYLTLLLILGSASYGVLSGAQRIFSLCFGIFLHISAYYLVLILLLPLLRGRISARACAMLWVIPNYLYITHQSFMELPAPKFVITLPGRWLEVLLGIWLVGFAAVLFWKIAEHLFFRHSVLKDAAPVTDPDTLRIWEKVLEDARIKRPKFKLVTSPHARTPLSIGLFHRTIRVILPQCSYSPEELELILRHEIVHIGREDAWSKFFLIFCTAMCWFNPLMWVAMRKSAEDLELSCDETVLIGADDSTRKQYAALLLDTAGDGRGFTTCLSASAQAMRHRLRGVTRPGKRPSGAIVVGLVFFVLCMTSGYVALAYGGTPGAELIFTEGDPTQYTVRHVTKTDDPFHTVYQVTDQEALGSYLSGLTLCQLSGNYAFSEGEQFIYLMDTPAGTLGVELGDHALKLVPLYGEEPDSALYYVPEGIDWDYLSTVVVAYPALNVELTEAGNPYGDDISALLDVLWVNKDGQRTLLFDSGYSDEVTRGIFGNSQFIDATFSFSGELASPCSVLVESWDRSESYTVVQTDLTEPFRFKLPGYPAHYTVYASFHGPDKTLYEAEFRFEIGEAGSI